MRRATPSRERWARWEGCGCFRHSVHIAGGRRPSGRSNSPESLRMSNSNTVVSAVPCAKYADIMVSRFTSASKGLVGGRFEPSEGALDLLTNANRLDRLGLMPPRLGLEAGFCRSAPSALRVSFASKSIHTVLAPRAYRTWRRAMSKNTTVVLALVLAAGCAQGALAQVSSRDEISPPAMDPTRKVSRQVCTRTI